MFGMDKTKDSMLELDYPLGVILGGFAALINHYFEYSRILSANEIKKIIEVTKSKI